MLDLTKRTRTKTNKTRTFKKLFIKSLMKIRTEQNRTHPYKGVLCCSFQDQPQSTAKKQTMNLSQALCVGDTSNQTGTRK